MRRARYRDDGYYHDRITLILAGIAIVVSAFAFSYVGLPNCVLFVCGILLCLIVNPDLDQPSITRAEGNVGRVFGKFAMRIWMMFWMPYTIIPHRSVISHSLFLSTMIRLCYLLSIPFFVLYNSGYNVYTLAEYVIPLYLGMCIGDAGHLWRDGILRIL